VRKLDHRLLLALRTRGHSPNLDSIMQGLGAVGEHGRIWAGIGLFGFVFSLRRQRQWLVAAGIGPAAIGLNYGIKRLVGRPRPSIEGLPPLGSAPSSLSFPSAHATSSVAAAIALSQLAPEARPYLFALAAAICVSRPYLGMHYPSDVVAGMALGAALGTAVTKINPDQEHLYP